MRAGIGRLLWGSLAWDKGALVRAKRRRRQRSGLEKTSKPNNNFVLQALISGPSLPFNPRQLFTALVQAGGKFYFCS